MQSFNFSSAPFVRLLLLLLLGRVIGCFFPQSFSVLFIIAAIAIICTIILLLSYNSKQYLHRWIFGAAISISFISVGAISNYNTGFNASLYNKEILYRAKVKSIVKDTDDRQSIIIRCTAIDSIPQYYFDALLYLSSDTLEQGLLAGDIIHFKSKLNPIKNTGNPYAFEYGKYMNDKGVVGQFFIRNKQYVKHKQTAISFSRFFYKTRNKAEEKLQALQLGNAERAIISALVLGNKSALDYHTKTNFSNAGAIHILSVSGLHVGIVYLILSVFIGKIGKGIKALPKVVVLLAALWFYAGLTGMSPSVSRSALMFSVFVIARWQSHSYNVYHSMAIAAFIILIITPSTILNAGFWLSFIAVGSIVYFFPLVNNSLYFTSPWGKYIWALISVSIAAQIGTFPLSISMFGFFPTWFLIANILLIPILPLLLIGAIFVIILPSNIIIVELISGVVSELVIYLNRITEFAGNLPNSTFTGIQLTFFQMLILYSSMAYFIVWQKKKYGKYLVYSLALFMLVAVAITIESHQKHNEKIFAVHQVRGKTVVSYTTKNKCSYWTDKVLEDKELSYVITPLVLHQHANKLQHDTLGINVVIPFVIDTMQIIIVNNKIDLGKITNSVDVIVFTSKVRPYNILRMLNVIDKQKIIFDSSFTTSQCRYLQKELTKQKLYAHFVTTDGAYVIKE